MKMLSNHLNGLIFPKCVFDLVPVAARPSLSLYCHSPILKIKYTTTTTTTTGSSVARSSTGDQSTSMASSDHHSREDDDDDGGGGDILVVVVMGVSGSGKSTVGNMLAKAMGCSFYDADDFHSHSNKEKMSKGIPLSEEDRKPWLETLSGVLQENIVNHKSAILGCSALQKKYREILRMADPNYKSGIYDGKVRFVCLEAPVELIAARLVKRAQEGNHFMPATLLQSQLDLLQIDDAEGIFMVDATLDPQVIVNNIRDHLFHTYKD